MTGKYPLLTKNLMQQACLSSSSVSMDCNASALQRRLASQSIIKIGRDGVRTVIKPGQTDGKIYFVLQIRKEKETYSSRSSQDDLRKEISALFIKSGLGKVDIPIPCIEQSRADNDIFHEQTLFSNHTPDPVHYTDCIEDRIHRKGQEDEILIYEFPASAKLKLATMMQSIESMKQKKQTAR